eukprot:5900712-Alexandrium_andersonii.AAC.1
MVPLLELRRVAARLGPRRATDAASGVLFTVAAVAAAHGLMPLARSTLQRSGLRRFLATFLPALRRGLPRRVAAPAGCRGRARPPPLASPVSYTHLRAHETSAHL